MADSASGAAPASMRGYQWKSLFLPEGTVLRSWSYSEHNYAEVVGDQIIHKGRAVSPNQFAQSFARTTRNAWTDLFVRRPGDKKYAMACRLRDEAAKLAQQQQQLRQPIEPTPAPAATAATAGLTPEAVLAALLAAMRTAPATIGPGAITPVTVTPVIAAPVITTPVTTAQAPSPPRDPTPGEGWTLPERRKFRFRLEDVAYD
ncbi:MAG: hypothetical protein ABW069_14995 [Duganella sp.]